MVSFLRTHTCGALTKADIGTSVVLSGWVHRRRDHGGLIFIDLRDRFGITQVVFKPTADAALHDKASELRSEWVIAVHGKVVPRAEGMVNTKLKSGEIEVEVSFLDILSKAKTPPFSIADDSITVSEELRLKYRYLDIRRGFIGDKLIARHKMMQAVRHYLSDESFLEISTPILAKSTPEGARDYLVPSRIYPGTFYALPQSPQLFKQLLMIAGMDRYFQIAQCFRDEDLRADRQPEFTQIDMEMSFATYEQLFAIVEGLVASIFKEVAAIDVPIPFPRMPYSEAISSYGTDKPDLRFGMKHHRLDDLASRSSFSVFLEALKAGYIVKGFTVPGGADISRRTIDEYTSFISKFGAQGLAWVKVTQEGISSSIAKFFDDDLMQALLKRMEAKAGDLVLIVAAPEKSAHQSLDHLRRHIAHERNLVDTSRFAFSWVVDFPLFQWDEETENYACEHHPFTSPHLEDIDRLESEPLKIRSSSYDLVLNGYEIASGSQRIHNGELQEKIFRLLKLDPTDIEKRFGFFIEALRYGTPPHLGIALGFDRLMMILTHTDNIRDVIAFPKTQKASDLMLEAPSEVMHEQLTELKIHVEPKES